MNFELPASFSPLPTAFCFLNAADPDGPPFPLVGAWGLSSGFWLLTPDFCSSRRCLTLKRYNTSRSSLCVSKGFLSGRFG